MVLTTGNSEQAKKTEDFWKSVTDIIVKEGIPLTIAALATRGLGLGALAPRLAPRLVALTSTMKPTTLGAIKTVLQAPKETIASLPALRKIAIEGAIGGLAYGTAKQAIEPEYTPTDVAEDIAIGATFPYALKGASLTLKTAAKLPKLPVEAVETLVKTPIPGLANLAGGRKTIQEIFQPAVERLPMMMQGAVRRPRSVQSRLKDLLTSVSKDLYILEPEDRLNLLRFMKDFDPAHIRAIKSPEGEKIAEKFLMALEDIAPPAKHRMARDEIFLKKVDTILRPQLNVINKNFDDFLPVWERFKPLKAQDYQVALRKITKDITIPDNVKEVAMHLHNLPSTMLDDYVNAVFRGELEFLKSKILRNPAWHSKKPKPGFVYSKIVNSYLPRDLELALRDISYFPRGWTKYVNELLIIPWKLGKVAWNIPTQIKNWIGNIIFNDIGGLPFWRVDVYIKAFKDAINLSPEFKKFQKLMGTDFTWVGAELYDILGPAKIRQIASQKTTPRFLLSLLDGLSTVRETKPYQMAFKPFGLMTRLYKASEIVAKYAKYLHNIEKGMTPKAALNDAIRWTFNYGEVTPLVAWLRSTILPFATWTSKAIPTYWSAVKEHPVRALKWPIAAALIGAYSLKEANVSDKEWEQIKAALPKYMQKGWIAPVFGRDKNGRLQIVDLTEWLPGFGDTWKLLKGIGSVSSDISGTARDIMQDPIRQTAVSILSNKTHFGAPIYNEWDPPETQFAKIMVYLYRLWAPSMVGDMLFRIGETVKGSTTALTPEQHLMRLAGISVQPMSEQQARIIESLKAKKARSEIRKALKKELTKYPDEREEIIKYYKELLEKRRREK